MNVKFYNEKYYEKLAKQYIDMNIWMKNRIQNVYEMVNLQPIDIILDVGCGIGTFTIESSKNSLYAVGLDISNISLSICKRLQRLKVTQPNVDFIKADASNLPLKDCIITKTICADLVEHLPNSSFIQLLDEIYRILIKNGSLIIYTPNEDHIFEILRRHNILLKMDNTHIAFKSTSFIITSLRKHKFKIKNIYYKESHVPIFKIFEKILMRIPKIDRLFRRRICVKSCASF